MNDTITLTTFQERVLTMPLEYDLFLGGGRGGAKSWTLAFLALRHIEQAKGGARVLYIRKSYKGLADFELTTRELFGAIYGRAASYNAQEHVWRFHHGGIVELGQLDGPQDYPKYQGRSFNLLLVDEAGQWAEPNDLDLLRSNLRAPKFQSRPRMIVAANPGGIGHHWLTQRYVGRATPWAPFVESESKRTSVYCPSTFRDNSHIDQAEYLHELEASCTGDSELLEAWRDGNWDIARGAFFSGVLDRERMEIQAEAWAHWANHQNALARWDSYLAHDYGSAAPSVTYVVFVSPGITGPDECYYPRESVLLLDELATYRPGKLNTGLGWTIDRLSDAIKEMAARWRIPAVGCADDAIFSHARGVAADSIADEFRRERVWWWPAKKGSRVVGWERMRRLCKDAGLPDRPGLFVANTCTYFWQTVPVLPRDPKQAQDVDSSAPDHAADACRYALTSERPVFRYGSTVGLY